MYLVLSPIDINMYNQGKELLLITPTILPFLQRDHLSKNGYSLVDNEEVYFNETELSLVNEKNLDLYRRVMKSIATGLNEYNKTEHNQRFWNIAVGRRVFDMIGRYYIAYRQVENVCKTYDDIETTITSTSKPSFEKDYLSLINNQYVIFSHILEGEINNINYRKNDSTLFELDKCFVSMKYINEPKQNNQEKGVKENIKKIVKWVLQANNNTEIILDTPCIERMDKLTVASRFKIKGTYNLFLDADREIKYYKEYSDSFQIPDLDFNPEDSFESIIKHNIWNWIPAVFSENFSKAEEIVYPLYSKCKARVVGSAYNYLGNDVYNLWSAHMSEKGAIVIAMDHRGTVCVDYNAEHEYETYDYFFTYGNMKSFPRHTNFLNGVCANHLTTDSVYFLRKKKIAEKRKRILYFEDYAYNPIPYCLMRSEEVGVMDALKQRYRFVDTIGKDNQCQLTMRAFSDIDHYESSAKYVKQYSNIDRHIMTEKAFEEAVADADIYVSDAVNGTPWQELIAVNQPILLLYNSKGQVLTEEGKCFINRMKKCKLIFEDGVLLAKYIESIKDPQKWWNDKERQNVLDEFRYKYMYIPKKKNRYRQLANCFFAIDTKDVEKM